MFERLGFILLFVSMSAMGQGFVVKENKDLSLTLSQNNYNRIVVKNDKITEAIFPPNAMAVKGDAQDGSVYVLLSSTNPFTLFLSTAAGHHFSVTINSEEALGKTIELVPEQQFIAKTNTPQVQKEPVVPEAILALLEHMETHKPFSDVVIKRQSGNIQQWSKGLLFKPKESWESKQLKGEAIELYNGGKKPLQLAQNWFAAQDTLAIKFSKPSIAPKESAMLYRISDVHHG